MAESHGRVCLNWRAREFRSERGEVWTDHEKSHSAGADKATDGESCFQAAAATAAHCAPNPTGHRFGEFLTKVEKY